eukprot:TRINITY_DN5070_c1_g1_i1.p1 TRINITY_DN5070_c1_g1~~TRINITY_DN5070_c1_g1_i1.p1  ORF type:complete len:872 (+),score=153.92 TRINITY_DN5070_c1_g1_i1:315-2930(+)
MDGSTATNIRRAGMGTAIVTAAALALLLFCAFFHDSTTSLREARVSQVRVVRSLTDLSITPGSSRPRGRFLLANDTAPLSSEPSPDATSSGTSITPAGTPPSTPASTAATPSQNATPSAETIPSKAPVSEEAKPTPAIDVETTTSKADEKKGTAESPAKSGTVASPDGSKGPTDNAAKTSAAGSKQAPAEAGVPAAAAGTAAPQATADVTNGTAAASPAVAETTPVATPVEVNQTTPSTSSGDVAATISDDSSTAVEVSPSVRSAEHITPTKPPLSPPPLGSPFQLTIFLFAPCTSSTPPAEGATPSPMPYIQWESAVSAVFTSLSAANYSGSDSPIDVTVFSICPEKPLQRQMRGFVEGVGWAKGTATVVDSVTSPRLPDQWVPKAATEHAFVLSLGSRVHPEFYQYLKAATLSLNYGKNTKGSMGVAAAGVGFLPWWSEELSGSRSLDTPSFQQGLSDSCQLFFGASFLDFIQWEKAVLEADKAPASKEQYKVFHTPHVTCAADWQPSFKAHMHGRNEMNLYPGRPNGEQLCYVLGPDKKEPTKKGEVATTVITEELPTLWATEIFEFCGAPKIKGRVLATTMEELDEMLTPLRGEPTIVTMMVNLGYEDMLNNLLCYLAELNIQSYLCVTSSLPQAQRLASLGHRAFFLDASRATHDAVDFGTFEYRQLLLERTKVTGEILNRGYNVLMADVDSVWLGNPFSSLPDSRVDIFAQAGEKLKVSTSFMFLRSTKRTIVLWDLVIVHFDEVISRLLSGGVPPNSPNAARWLRGYYESTEETIVNNVIEANGVRGLQVEVLSPNMFLNGKDYFEMVALADESLNETDYHPVVVHNNRIKGKKNKVHRFKLAGFWRLDEAREMCRCLACRPTS